MASNKIRGITIKLGADTSEFSKALGSINTDIKNTKTQLNDVNKLLKFDPTNTELLAQKQQLVTQAIEQTNEKIKLLKDAQDKLDANGIDRNSEQYQALQREIIAAQQDVDKLSSTETDSVGTLEKMGDAAKGVGDKFTDLGNKLMGVSDAIVDMGKKCIDAFEEVDAGADIVIKKTGATGEAAEALEDVYEKVATSVTGSFEDAGAAVGEVNTRFGVTGDELQALSEEFVKFAQINDQDVTQAVTGVDQAMAIFGVDQKEVYNVMGKLTKASQDTGIGIQELESLLQSNGATFYEMGLGIGDAIDLMANFETEGIDASQMLASLKKAATSYSQDGLTMSEGLSDLITRLQDTSTNAEATAEAYEIFGSRGGLAFVSMAEQGKISFDDINGTLEGYNTVVNDTYQQTLDGTDQMDIAWKSVQTAAADLGATIGNVLAPIFQTLADVISQVKAWFDNLSPGMQEAIVIILGIVAAIGPLLVILGQVISIVSTVGSVMSFVAAGPIGIIIAAIAGIIAITTLLVQNWDEVVAWFQGIFETIGQFFVDLWNTVTEFFGGIFSAIGEFFGSIFTNIGTWINDNIIQPIKDFFGKAWELGKNLVEGLWEGITGAASWLWDKITGWIGGVWDGILGLFGVHSPSKKMMWIGEMLDEGLAKGIEDNADVCADAAADMAEEVGGAVEGLGMGELSNSINATGARINAAQNVNVDNTDILGILGQYIPFLKYLGDDRNIYIDSNKLVGATAKGMNVALGQLAIREGR